jgi:hypothetical protein
MLLAVLCLPLSAHAQQARLDIFVELDPLTTVQACDFDFPGPGGTFVGTATVRVISAFPFQTVRFKAPIPCGMTVIGSSSAFAMAGSPETGVTITTGACTGAPVDVLTITFLAATTPVTDCTWDVAPADGDAAILLTDCDGYSMTGASARSIYCGDVNGFIAPYRPYPADGATDVPPNPSLSFIGVANLLSFGTAAYPLTPTVCDVPFGTLCDNPFDPGMLAPNTTYYWYAVYSCVASCPHGEGAVSDFWSFTTGDLPVAVEETTWGRVKALSRD